MTDSKKRRVPEELTDDALDLVTGGTGPSGLGETYEMMEFERVFKLLNCITCNKYGCNREVIIRQVFEETGGDQNADCPHHLTLN